MVVLEQNHIEEPDSVVLASAYLDRLLLEVAQSGCGLAGVKDITAGVSDERLVAVGGSGNAGHELHDIEHCALDLQKAQFAARHAESYVAFLDLVAIVEVLLNAERRVKVADNFFGYFHACEDAFGFDDELLATLQVFGNAAKGCMVALANIFAEP